jgi:hypothetical protein
MACNKRVMTVRRTLSPLGPGTDVKRMFKLDERRLNQHYDDSLNKHVAVDAVYKYRQNNVESFQRSLHSLPMSGYFHNFAADD